MTAKYDVRHCKRLSHVCKSQTPPPHRDQYEEGTTGNKWNSEQRERSFSYRGDRYKYQWLWIAGRHQREGSVGCSLSRQSKRLKFNPLQAGRTYEKQRLCLLSSKWCCVCELSFIWCSVRAFLCICTCPCKWSGGISQRQGQVLGVASYFYLSQICRNLKSALLVMKINTAKHYKLESIYNSHVVSKYAVILMKKCKWSQTC